MSDLFDLMRRLRVERPSRNRHFEELSQPLARRARKLIRRLDDLERELRSGARGTLRTDGRGGGVLILEYPDVRVKRAAHLNPEERQLLLDDPEIAALLRR